MSVAFVARVSDASLQDPPADLLVQCKHCTTKRMSAPTEIYRTENGDYVVAEQYSQSVSTSQGARRGVRGGALGRRVRPVSSSRDCGATNFQA